jgi:carboxypeptidase Taq
MADALDQLKERLAEVQDLGKIARILGWDQQTKMPRAGAKHRAEQFGTLSRISHEKFTDPAVGKLLDELRPLEDSLDPDSDDACLIRLTRRDYEKASKVPSSLRAEIARASSEGNGVWVKARAENDFASFLPVLQRNVELKLQYVDLVADGADERYDVLLDDYEPQAKTAEVRVRGAQALARRAHR